MDHSLSHFYLLDDEQVMNTITLVECPYCRKNFIPENGDIVCDKCTGLLSLDLAIVEASAALAKALTMDDKELRKRIDSLSELTRQARMLQDKIDELKGEGR